MRYPKALCTHAVRAATPITPAAPSCPWARARAREGPEEEARCAQGALAVWRGREHGLVRVQGAGAWKAHAGGWAASSVTRATAGRQAVAWLQGHRIGEDARRACSALGTALCPCVRLLRLLRVKSDRPSSAWRGSPNYSRARRGSRTDVAVDDTKRAEGQRQQALHTGGGGARGAAAARVARVWAATVSRQPLAAGPHRSQGPIKASQSVYRARPPSGHGHEPP